MGAKKGLIFGSRPCRDWSFLREYAQWPDIVIAADGGLQCAKEAGFSPQIYIGDGDSGGHTEENMTCICLKPQKDLTDLEAAYEWAKDHGLTDLIFTGCSGGRLDHHLGALALLEQATREGIHVVLLDERNRAEFLLPNQYSLQNHGYRYFSVLPVNRLLRDVCISGAKYPLKHRNVVRGSSLMISNEFSGDTVDLCFADGCCFFVESNDG